VSQEKATSPSARSHEQVLRAIFDAWARGDMTAGTELLAEDIRFSAAQPEGQVRADGRAAMSRFNRDFFASWKRWWVELDDLEQCSPTTFLASGQQHGVGRGSDTRTSMPTFVAIGFRGEEIAQLEFFYNRPEAVKAVGWDESAMSQNTETAERAINAWNRCDLDAFLREWHVECEWRPAFPKGTQGTGSVFHGHAALAQAWQGVRDALLVLGSIYARGTRSEVALESPWSAVVRFRDGKLVSAWDWLDHAPALKAVGLEE
jgi:ketosteroid isomerase-like protein